MWYLKRKILKCVCTIAVMYLITAVLLIGISVAVFFLGLPELVAKLAIMGSYVIIGFLGGIFWVNTLRLKFCIYGSEYIVPVVYFISWCVITNLLKNSNKSLIHVVLVLILVLSSFIIGVTYKKQ